MQIDMAERKYKNPQVNLRLPLEIKDRLAELAEINSRSLNSEMVAALSAWVDKNQSVTSNDITSINLRIDALELEVKRLNDSISSN